MQLSRQLTGPGSTGARRAGEAGAGAAGGASSGLVSLSTSYTGSSHGPQVQGLAAVSIPQLRMARVRRGVLSAASVICDEAEGSGVRVRAVMVTTTYRPDVAWGPRHITAALNCMWEWARRRRVWVMCVWRLEFTQRGVPHYHVLVWFPASELMPMWDEQGWWPHGMTRTTPVARSAVGYLAKYASKACDWPAGTGGTSGARWFGVRGLSLRGRLRARWRAAPAWVRDRWPEGEPLKRLAGSWWRLGSFVELRSPWAASPVGDGFVFRWRGWGPDDVRLVAA